MCTETKNVAGALATPLTMNQPAPILTVNDPKIDLPENANRRKVLAALGLLMPASARATECQNVHMPPYNQGDSRRTYSPGSGGNYKMLMVGEATNSCAPFNVSVMTLIGATGAWGFWSQYGAADDGTGKQKQQDGWVSYADGLLPSVGDTFVLYVGASAHHCGTICEVDVKKGGSLIWFTGDGGQPDRTGDLHKTSGGRWTRSYNTPDPNYAPDATADLKAHEAAYLVPRMLDCSNVDDAKLANFFVGGGGESLRGWRSVTHPKVHMKDLSDKASGSDDDYQSFKARINAMRALVDAEVKQRAGTP